MKAILYIGHGSRSKRGAEEARAFIQGVMNWTNEPAIQEYGFLELAEPSIEAAFEHCIDRGAEEIVVVPLFLLAAGHIKQDIPRILSSMQLKYPFVRIQMREPFGIQDRMLDAMADMVRTVAGRVLPEDRILIVGRGSSDPMIQEDFAAIVNGMKGRLEVASISVCYLAAAKPTLQEGLERITKHAAGRIVLVPYLLFSGLLLTEIDRYVRVLKTNGYDIVHTGPLCRHRVIEDLVIERAAREHSII